MVDFYEEDLNFKIFISFLLLGLFLSFILIPLSFFLHSAGHGIFGSAVKCKFVGIYLPLDNHSSAVLNYPNAIFSGTKISLLYWAGGHLFIFVLMMVGLLFPTGTSLIEMITKELSCFYLAFFGGFVEGILAFGGEEATSIPDILKINPYFFLFFLSLFYLFFSFYFLFRLISSFGKVFKESLVIPLFLSFSLWYLPLLIYLFFIYFMKGIVYKIHFPVYVVSTIFLFISPLIPRGKNIFQKPKFTKPIYGIFLFSVFILFIFYFLFYRKEFPLLLWGEVSTFCNLPLEVNL